MALSLLSPPASQDSEEDQAATKQRKEEEHGPNDDTCDGTVGEMRVSSRDGSSS